MKTFYHNDLDGKCCGHIVDFFVEFPTSSESFFPMEYGKEFPLDKIEKDETVYILDYSVDPLIMSELLKITDDIIWIDHHKSAIEEYAGVFEDLTGIRKVGTAACALTYEWCLCNKYRGTNETFADIPEYVKLIGDRDTWTFEYGDRTKFFCAGLEAEDTHPRSPAWGAMRACPESFIEQGKIVVKYQEQSRNEYLREHGQWVNFDGRACFACNTPAWGIPAFEAVAPAADIWISYRQGPGDFWAISLYSTKINVREIAELRGGGGHDKAAGFQCYYPPFLQDLDETWRRIPSNLWKCNYFKCISGIGLAGSDSCPGDPLDKNCPSFEPREEFFDKGNR